MRDLIDAATIKGLCSALIICFALTSHSAAQRTAPGSAQTGPSSPTAIDAVFVREKYSKYEYRIPMRDGVKLFTSVYVPRT